MKLKHALLLAMVTVPLAACGDSSEEEKAEGGNEAGMSQEMVAAESKKLVKPKPGQYSSKTEVTRFEVPGVPEQQAEQMKQMFTGLGAEEQSFCLTPVQANKGFEETIRKMGEGEQGMSCKYERFSVKGEKLDARLACDAGAQGQATMTLTGTVNAENQLVQMLIEQKSGQIPGGVMNIGMKVTTKRTGECTAESKKAAEEAEQAAAASPPPAANAGAQDAAQDAAKK